jgi:outer membrane receptor protein involved in Fe transport
MNTHKSTSNPVLAVCSILALAGGMSHAAPVAAQNEEASTMEEVTVTAQKREQALAEIPMSVTVLKGDILEQQNADNFQDLVSMVPGLSITSATPGVTRITLRGINTGGVSSTVGVYIDEVPFGSSSGLANGAVLSGDFDTFDLARVEVLRGPQGTLYGASSLGGVFKYVPNRPSSEAFEVRGKGSMESVKDGGLGYAVTGVVNAPVSDTFAVRVSGFYRFDDGFIDSIGNHPVPTLTDPTVNVIEGTQVASDLNSTDTYGGRVQALFTPTEKLSVNLMAMMQDINSDASSQIDADPLTLAPLNDSPVQSRYQDAFNDISYRVYSATIDWDFDTASLQSITGWGEFEQDYREDVAIGAALTGGPPLASLLTFLFDDPSTPEIAPKLSAILPKVTSTDKFTQELRLVSPQSDTLEWLVGGYYTDEDSVLDQLILAVDAGTENLTPGFPELAVAKVLSNFEEIALFANATWYMTPQFELSFGARTSKNDQNVTQITDGPLAGGSLVEIIGESSESPFTWSFSPRYKLDDNSSVYVRVATGYRPGGPNLLPPGAPPGTPASYDSDSLTSYEAGYKMNTADGRFGFDISAYFLDWNDIQLFTRVNGFGVNGNGGKAESKGVEFAASYAPLDGLSLSFNGAYTDAQLTEDTEPEVGGLDGDPLPFVPDWSLGLAADYEWVVGSNSTAYVGGNLGYTGERSAGLADRDPAGGMIELPNFTTINLRAGFETGRWAFEVYAKNVTDELGISSVGTDDTIATGWINMGVIRPRTIGVSVGARF